MFFRGWQSFDQVFFVKSDRGRKETFVVQVTNKEADV